MTEPEPEQEEQQPGQVQSQPTGVNEGNQQENQNNQQSESVDNWKCNVTVDKVGEKFIKKFNTKALDYEVRIDNLQGNIDQRIPVEQLIDRITVSLQQMLDQVLVGIPNHDFVRLVINNRHLQTSINLPFVRREHINLATVLQILTNLLNSNEDFLIDGTLEVNLIHVQRMQGGRSKKPWASHGEKIHKSTATVEIKNKDNMCLARAIVVGKAKADKDQKKYDTIRKQFGPKSLQTEEATKLCLAAGVDPKVKCGLKEIDKFQVHLKDYQICVVSKDHMNTFIYKGVKKTKRSIWLMVVDILILLFQ